MTHTSVQQTSVANLGQLVDLLHQMEPEDYRRSLPILSGGSVGKHVRHIVEFYQCLFNGVPEKEVDYDARERNLFLETDLYFAGETLQEIMHQINRLAADQLLYLRASYPPDETILIPTSMYRELIYNLEHCVHHQATIRIGVQTMARPYALDPAFGVAPSTIRHQQTVCAP